jgi:hypothetical protein
MPKASIGCLDVATILIMINKPANHICIGMGMIGAIHTTPLTRTLVQQKYVIFSSHTYNKMMTKYNDIVEISFYLLLLLQCR